MRSSTLRSPRGPFAVPARSLLLAAGVCAIALGAVNLFHERHSSEVDNLYIGIAVLIGVIWLISLILAYRGVKAGVAIAGAIAFLEFGLLLSSHFVTSSADITSFARLEGLSVAPIVMTLTVLCSLTFMTAIVAWTHPTGHLRPVRLLPFLLSSVAGAILVILYATDSVRRSDFGTATPEDGTFAASVSATFWLFGGLWIARARKTGALLIGLGTFMATFSFIALHIVKGGHTLGEIAATSGPGWGVVAAAMAGLAAVSLLVALGILGSSLVRERQAARPASAAPPARRAGSA